MAFEVVVVVVVMMRENGGQEEMLWGSLSRGDEFDRCVCVCDVVSTGWWWFEDQAKFVEANRNARFNKILVYHSVKTMRRSGIWENGWFASELVNIWHGNPSSSECRCGQSEYRKRTRSDGARRKPHMKGSRRAITMAALLDRMHSVYVRFWLQIFADCCHGNIRSDTSRFECIQIVRASEHLCICPDHPTQAALGNSVDAGRTNGNWSVNHVPIAAINILVSDVQLQSNRIESNPIQVKSIQFRIQPIQAKSNTSSINKTRQANPIQFEPSQFR